MRPEANGAVLISQAWMRRVPISATSNLRAFSTDLSAVSKRLLAAQLAFLALILLSGLVPNAAIRAQIDRAYATGHETVIDWPETVLGTEADRFTECLELSVGLTGNVLSDQVSPGCQQLRAGKATLPYFRYWNGSAVATRPLVAWIGVAGTRWILTVLVGLALLALVLFVRAGAWLAVPLLLTTDLGVSAESLPHAVSLIAALTGAAVVGRARNVAQAAALAGAAYAFVDQSTNPPLAWGLVIAAAGLARRDVRAQVTAGWAWFIGWFGTWATKWLVALPVVGPAHVLASVRQAFALRLLGKAASDPLVANLVWWLRGAERPLLIVSLTIVAMALCATALLRNWSTWRDIALVTWPGLLPIAWFERVRNHSTVHAWFTYRALALPLGLLLAGGWVAYGIARKRGSPASAAPRDSPRSRGDR